MSCWSWTRRLLVFGVAMCAVVGCAAKQGFYHRVAKGETLYRISQAYEVPLDTLTRTNNLRNPGALREGQFILVPDEPGNVDPATVKRRLRREPDPFGDKVTGEPARREPTKPGSWEERRKQAPQRLSASNLAGRFTWPMREGRFHKARLRFGTYGQKRHLGLDIVAPLGTQVVSIGDGKVVYIGEQVKGFGKTIIVRHAEEIFSIYSFLDKTMVVAGAELSRGATLGTVGFAEEEHFGEEQPLLHLEVRERTIPLDPENLLP